MLGSTTVSSPRPQGTLASLGRGTEGYSLVPSRGHIVSGQCVCKWPAAVGMLFLLPNFQRILVDSGASKPGDFIRTSQSPGVVSMDSPWGTDALPT